MGLDSKLAARLSPNQSVSVWYQRSRQDGVRNYKDLWGGLGRLQSTLEPQDLHFGYVRWERLNLGWLDSLAGTFSANAQGGGSRRQGLRATDSVTIPGHVILEALTFLVLAHLPLARLP